MSSDDPIEISSFCEDFPSTPKLERNVYVANEIRRIERAGLPVLRTVLSCSDDEAQTMATALLDKNVDKDGEQILDGHVWRLRLVADAVPPSTDPQGRPLPPEKRGKVLSVKVGNKGGNLEDDSTVEEWKLHSGPARTVKVRAQRDLYNLVEVTRSPKSYSLRHAIFILRAWGVGCTAEKTRMEHKVKNDPSSDLVPVQENWIVEEVLEPRDASGSADNTSSKKARAA